MTFLPRGHVTDAVATVTARLPEILEHLICAREAGTHGERIRRLQEAVDQHTIIGRALAAALAVEFEAITPAEAARRCDTALAPLVSLVPR